jgi:hypothetical protein
MIWAHQPLSVATEDFGKLLLIAGAEIKVRAVAFQDALGKK